MVILVHTHCSLVDSKGDTVISAMHFTLTKDDNGDEHQSEMKTPEGSQGSMTRRRDPELGLRELSSLGSFDHEYDKDDMIPKFVDPMRR